MENLENNKQSLNDYAAIRNKIRDARKEGMTKGARTAAIVGAITLIVLAVAGYSLYKVEHNKQLARMEEQKVTFSNQVTAFSQKLNERDSLINEWVTTFNQIEKDLDAIKQREKIITIKSSDSEFLKNKKDQVLHDIKYINTLLENNKAKIAALNAQLQKSGITIKGMQDKIAELEASVKQYENDIAELKTTLVKKDFEISQLNSKMSDLDLTITQQNEKITDQTRKLNQAFLVCGTYKDLRDKGILSKEGGFLGIGRKEALVNGFSDSLFKKIDVTETKTITINSRDAKLITEHPEGSYEIINGNDKKIASIEIRNPDEFWKISKYAVIEIK
jgi:hypothetical protein